MTLHTLSVVVSPRGIATLTLNRPDRGNAVNPTMMSELVHQLAELEADEAVRVVVLRGNGKHFCSGADLNARAEPGVVPSTLSLPDVLTKIDTFGKPTVAVVQGAAIGAGAAFAACCDVVIAIEGAFFSIPEVRIGMAPLGVAPFLIRAMGHRSFRRYGLSGERIDAAEARRIGLAHAACDAGGIDKTLDGITDALLHGAPNAMRELKADMDRYASPPTAEISPPAHAHGRSPEALEGIASFKEKRKPSWYPQ